ncbi:MAG TPA: succinyldiaminopimelate transaminase [Actinomycetes bacterium]|nr:succinyldiaminopimelate transaminase [Actinomycetes bacterium]
MTDSLRGAAAERLPDFPWDRLAAASEQARAHPGGLVDLSVGTPVDPVPALVQQALAAASNAPGYPTTQGSAQLRDAAVRWLQRRLGVTTVGADDVLPVNGSKELVAWLPFLLGVGPGQRVVVPALAYPTYEIGARLSGADVVATDSLLALGPARVSMVWVNSPSNPAGRVLPVDHLAKVVAWARERGAVVVSDECYVELGWEERPVSVLHPDVCGGSSSGLLVVHSMSKRSNLAGYRAGFVTGDSGIIASLLRARKHAGMMMPTPVQAAMTAALEDDAHVAEQRQRYRGRRELLRAALIEAGLRIDHSQAGLYLWASRDEPCWATVGWLAERGVLVAPGDFYGAGGAQHVRVSLTATDEDIETAAARISPT